MIDITQKAKKAKRVVKKVVKKTVNSGVNNFFRIINHHHMMDIDFAKKDPVASQQRIFDYLLKQGRKTKFGKDHDFDNIHDIHDFQSFVPIRSYEGFFHPYIEYALLGMKNMMRPGLIPYFGVTGGTTQDKNKFVPQTKEFIRNNQFASSKAILTHYIQNFPDSSVLMGKILNVPGVLRDTNWNGQKITVGDQSAIYTSQMPSFTQNFSFPSPEVCMLPFDEMKKHIVQGAPGANVKILTGLPKRTLAIVQEIVDFYQVDTIYEIRPNLEAMIYSGTSIKPYQKLFESIAPGITFIEGYNTSEGFIAFQDTPNRDLGLLLMANADIFFEFMPAESYPYETTTIHTKALTVADLKVGHIYEIIVSTTSGLWRYRLGDLIKVVSTSPIRIQREGRISQCINLAAEKVSIGNMEQAMYQTCLEMKIPVPEFVMAPSREVLTRADQMLYYDCVVDFGEKVSVDMEHMTELLDAKLGELNADYLSARQLHYLSMMKVTKLSHGTIHKWMQSRKKVGGQAKVPRLSMSRKHIEELLKIS